MGLVLLGCSGGGLNDPRKGAPPATCPANATPVGAPGATTFESHEIRWQQQGGGLSYLDDYFYLEIPDDLVGLTVVVEAGEERTGFLRALQPGRQLLDANRDGLQGERAPFFHFPEPVGSLTFPMNAETSLEPGCLALDPYVAGKRADQLATLHVASKRTADVGSLRVNIVFVADTQLEDGDLDTAVALMDQIYRDAGAPAVTVAARHQLPWEKSVVSARRESEEVRDAFDGGNPGELDLFFVRSFDDAGTLGIAGGTPGPNGVPGTVGSGVMIAVDAFRVADGGALDAELMGETMAHEAAHQLGLFHTTEFDGTIHDGIADTPECRIAQDADGDKQLVPEECVELDGANLMFWTTPLVIEQRSLSPEQVAVLNAGPLASGVP